MKHVAGLTVAIVLCLLALPVLVATGDVPRLGCGVGGDGHAVLATIRTLESRGDYTARAAGSTASGAYQFTDQTWNNTDGYPAAWQAPPEVQDAKALEHVTTILDRHDGDVSAIGVVWYLGHLPAPNSAEWDNVSAPDAGNVLTPRQYQQRWMTEYQTQLAAVAGDGVATDQPQFCQPGMPLEPLPDGFAYPAPPDMFATAPVDAPHHDYPAWDWALPVGTSIYAIQGGTVSSVSGFGFNWWDHGCGTNQAGCHPCGIGLTIEDAAGNQWGYCHGSASRFGMGDTVAAGAQILASGNTGRSSGPHLHLQIRTPDGRLRCPQRLLREMRDQGVGVDPAALAATGCTT